MFVLVRHRCGVFSVLDTSDGIVENVSLPSLRNYIKMGVEIAGVSIRPEFGDGQDVFLDWAESAQSLKKCGVDSSKYGLD